MIGSGRLAVMSVFGEPGIVRNGVVEVENQNFCLFLGFLVRGTLAYFFGFYEFFWRGFFWSYLLMVTVILYLI